MQGVCKEGVGRMKTKLQAFNFIAEIREIKQRKTASLDNEYSIKLVTDDKSVMLLSEIPSDETVDVIIERHKA
jgi:hypothetical protein